MLSFSHVGLINTALNLNRAEGPPEHAAAPDVGSIPALVFGLWNFSLSGSRIALVKTGHSIANTVKPPPPLQEIPVAETAEWKIG